MSLLNRLLDKEVVVTNNLHGHEYGHPGTRIILKKRHGTQACFYASHPESPIIGHSVIHLDEFDINPETFFTPSSEKFEIVKPRKETEDEYQNLSVVELRENNIIYLSSALRTSLQIDSGEKVVFAKSESKFYIAKNDEGSVVGEDGTFISVQDYRNLVRKFGQSIIFCNFIPYYNVDYPDFKFYEMGTKPYEQYKFKSVKFNPGKTGLVEAVKSAKMSANKLTNIDYDSEIVKRLKEKHKEALSQLDVEIDLPAFEEKVKF